MASTFYGEKQKRCLEAKFAVAFRAVLFLQEGDSLLIDAGTSLTPIAKIIRAMTAQPQYVDSTHFTIMTHNRGAFDSLIDCDAKAHINLFQTGGRYDQDLNASFGSQAENAYENYHPKWVFIGQTGMDADRGLFCHGNTEELSLKQIVFSKPAFCRVIISDYTKLGIPAGLCFGSSDRLSDNVEHCILITNNPRRDPTVVSQPDCEVVFDRYERQVSILSETHKVRIVEANYTVTRINNTVTIALEETQPPAGAPKWMGVEGTNVIRLEETGGDWNVTCIEMRSGA